jgi:DNA helicase HerA-like ATPase
MKTALQQHLEEYRELRTELERSILPIASSVDGRRFEFQAPLHGFAVAPGGYVMLGDRLGQVLSTRLEHTDAAEVGWESADGGPGVRTRLAIRVARGAGVVLAGDGAPFHDAEVTPAGSPEVAAWQGTEGLPVGELRLAPGVPFALDPAGFGRHTFFCGQSGSGKSYSLGVVLEQLLLGTDMRVVILDPNSDFARFATVRPDADPAAAARWEQLAPTIDIRSGTALKLRLNELGRAAQAAMLRLDPIADREEYADLIAAVDELSPGTLDGFGDAVLQRARNLGVDRWGVWARGAADTAIAALGDDRIRCLTLDIGSLDTREEQALVAETVLDHLWEHRADRRRVLIVIDEAHNVCPREPRDPLTALAADHAVRIAAEGRKFGLHLLVCTQRPQKVQVNVVSQCDNLVLMRMGSAADLEYTGELLSYAPRDLLAGASTFGLGEALVAGGLSSHPALIRFGRRVAEEGGADVKG